MLSSFGNFGIFGWIVQVVVGAIQGTTLAVSDAVELDKTKKYLKSIKKSQDIMYGTLLENKRKELEHREKILGITGQTELLRDQKLKKLVIIGSVTVIGVIIIALIVAYSIAVDDSDVITLEDIEGYEQE